MSNRKSGLSEILFIDIETSSQYPKYSFAPFEIKEHWKNIIRRNRRFIEDDSSPSDISKLYIERAGIYAEFGQIICISVGYLLIRGQNRQFRVKSFMGDEHDILTSFFNMVGQYFNDLDIHCLCGHNIKEFDVPFICRRAVRHSLELPRLFRISGYKPWQLYHLLDTMELWKFGDRKNFTSLDLLCQVLKLPSSKSDLHASEVSNAYWLNEYDRIRTYCEKDVVAVANVYLKLTGRESLSQDEIYKAEEAINA